jgi:hypothetical protein
MAPWYAPLMSTPTNRSRIAQKGGDPGTQRQLRSGAAPEPFGEPRAQIAIRRGELAVEK